MKVISIINNKGGVGKSTTAFNLAMGLGKKGKKVLAIDFDSQANMTYLFTDERSTKHIVNFIEGENLEECIQEFDNVHLIPSHLLLSAKEMQMTSEMGREFILKRAIDKVKGDYDYVIIDSVPSLTVLMTNTLVASDKVIIPCKTDLLSLEGLDILIETMKKYSSQLNIPLEIAGILPTIYTSNQSIDAQVLDYIKSDYPYRVLEPIRKNVKLSETGVCKQSIFDYAPKSSGSVDYMKLVEEVINGI